MNSSSCWKSFYYGQYPLRIPGQQPCLFLGRKHSEYLENEFWVAENYTILFCGTWSPGCCEHHSINVRDSRNTSKPDKIVRPKSLEQGFYIYIKTYTDFSGWNQFLILFCVTNFNKYLMVTDWIWDILQRGCNNSRIVLNDHISWWSKVRTKVSKM